MSAETDTLGILLSTETATLIAACIAALTAILGTIFTVVQSANSQGKQRLIETVSNQRIEWINKIRNCFSEYSELIERITMKRLEKSEIGDLQFKLSFLSSHIDLLLNPTENITEKYSSKRNDIKRYLLNDKTSDFSFDEYSKMMLDLRYLEQVILKSEWKRLKQEAKKGKENKNMNDIHIETAKNIDIERFNRLFNE